MKEILLDPSKRIKSETIFKSNGFSYRMVTDLLEWPEGYEKATVASVACDSEDKIFLLTRDAKKPLVVFDQKGKFLYAGAEDCFAKAHGLFITPDDRLLCTDAETHVCYVMDKHGNVCETLGKMNSPSDTGYDPDIYKKLQARGIAPTDAPVDKRTEFLARLDTIQRTAGPFNRPTRLVAADDGKLFCSDGYGNAAVHRFSKDLKLEISWGKPGKEPGAFRTVHGVWVDRKSRVWVADRENNRIQVFTRDGELLMIAEGMLRPTDFWEDSRHIYCSETDGGVSIFNMAFEVVAQIGYKNSPLLAHSIGGNSQGDLFIATLGLSKVHRFIKLECM